MKEAMERAAYLLRAVELFIKKNPIADYVVRYDRATCDGSCLAEDCKIAADELELQIHRYTNVGVKP